MKRLCTALGVTVMLLLAALLVLLVASVVFPSVLTFVLHLTLFSFVAIVLTATCVVLT